MLEFLVAASMAPGHWGNVSSAWIGHGALSAGHRQVLKKLTFRNVKGIAGNI